MFRDRGATGVTTRALRAAWESARRRFPRVPSRVSVALLKDTKMAELHEQFSGIAGTTDVLSFDLRAASGAGAGGPFEAEIAIGVETAARTAARRGIRFDREVELYLVHGLLHLAGFDDHHPGDRRRMRAAERLVLGRRELTATRARR